MTDPNTPPAYERFGEAIETCLVDGRTHKIPRYRTTFPGYGTSVYVTAPMCPECDHRYRLGLLPVHPYWYRQPSDPSPPRKDRRF